MPASLMTFPHTAISDFTVAAISSGGLATVSIPACSNLSLASALRRYLTTSLLRRATMAEGVFAGTNSAYIEADSKLGTEAATVGTPGNNGEGCKLDTASRLRRPDFTKGIAVPAAAN